MHWKVNLKIKIDQNEAISASEALSVDNNLKRINVLVLFIGPHFFFKYTPVES